MQSENYLEKFEEKIRETMYSALLSKQLVDKRMPDMPDIDEQWMPVLKSYLPDGIREFAKYPLVSIGWMMYIGMAVAQLWDEDDEEVALSRLSVIVQDKNVYEYLRDQRGFDCLDEYVREDVLHHTGEEYKSDEKLVGDMAQMVNSMLRREGIEPGTPMAFRAYVNVLHQMYIMGAAMQLYRLGYRMTKA